MASKAFEIEPDEAVAIAARHLMSVNVLAGASYVSFPLFYPSGSACVVKVEAVGDTFEVSDYGATYREVDHLGLGSGFAKSAQKIVSEIGGKVRDQAIICRARVDTLAMTMADVALASAQVAAKMIDKVGTSLEQQIQLELVGRLEKIFGKDAVQPDERISGQSAKEWEVDALVHHGGALIVFDFVRKRAQSVYAVSAKFHDIRAVERPPLAVAVVESKEELGPYHSILAQAGRVIEASQTDDVFMRAAA